MSSVARTSGRAVLVGVALMASVLAASCGRSDADAAIRQATIDLGSVSAAGSVPSASLTLRTKVYTKVIQDLTKAAGSPRGVQASTAHLLRARANAGLGDIDAGRADVIERQAMDRVAVLRALADQWQSLSASAAALEQYDPRDALADLDKQTAAKDKERDEARAAKKKADEAVAALEARAQEALAKAKTERDAEAAIRHDAVGKSETEREALIVKASQRKRAGDALDKQAAQFRAEAAMQAPNADELQRQIERLNKQFDLLSKAKAQTIELAQKMKERAKATRDDAAQSAQQIAEKLAQLLAIRGALEKPAAGDRSPYDVAATEYRAAIDEAEAAARGVKGEPQSVALMAKAAHQHSLAALVTSKARGMQAWASLLEVLATMKPALPEAARYGKDAEEAKKAFDNGLAQANKAYIDAKDSYAKVGGSKEVKDRLEEVGKILEQIATGEVKPEKPAPAPPAGGTGGDAAAPSKGTSEEQVRAMLNQLIAAMSQGQFDKIGDYILFKDDAQRQAFQSVMPFMVKAAAFDGACKAKYGQDFQTIVQQSKSEVLKTAPLSMLVQMISVMGKAADFGPVSSKDATVKVLDDSHAEVGVAGSEFGDTLKVVKADGRWKAEVPMPEVAGADLKVLAPALELFGKFLDETTGNIKRGEYPNGPAMLGEFEREVQSLVADNASKFMPGPTKPPGKK